MRAGLVGGLIGGLAVVGLLMPGATMLASAQEATPAAAELPVAPDPSLCQVEPRPLAFFEQYVGTPTAMAAATPEATPIEEGADAVEGTMEGFVPPVGQAADPETVDAVVATAVEVVACFNAGDLPRAFALYTDDLIDVFAGAEPLPQEQFDIMAATPAAVPVEAREQVLAIREVVILPDGRAGGFVDFAFAGGYRETQYVVLTQEGERWLVDEILLFAPLEGTPAP
ncbi:MAG: hypothetical protein M3Q50_02055 [Chloroflexota bacterium]|nr:hypothetical protein [Chloroflexota bacterium]